MNAAPEAQPPEVASLATAGGRSAALYLALQSEMKIARDYSVTHNYVEGREADQELAIDLVRTLLQTAQNPHAPLAKRVSALSEIKPFIDSELYAQLAHDIAAAGRTTTRVAFTSQIDHGPILITSRLARQTRTARHTTSKRVASFGHATNCAASSDDSGGGDPPSSAGLAASITRFEPPHAARLEPPIARRGGLLPASEYLSTTRVRQVIGARS